MAAVLSMVPVADQVRIPAAVAERAPAAGAPHGAAAVAQAVADRRGLADELPKLR